MALDTYSDLQTAILSWLARPGDPLVSPAVPDIIRLFEREANRRLKTGASEKRAQLHALSSAVDLPADFAELRLATSGGCNLSYVPPMQLPGLSGMPGHYTIVGNTMHLGPSPSGEAFIDIIYQSGVPPLSDTSPTNWLLTRHPDCYLFGSLVEATAFIGHDERIQLWGARLQAAFESIESADRKARWNGSPLQIRADGFPGSGGSTGAGDWSGAAPVPIPITSVVAGTGLTGGGSSGIVTLALGTPVPVSLGGSGATTVAGAPWATRVATTNVPPPTPQDGDLWWDTAGTAQKLYVWIDDGVTTPAWVLSTDIGPAGPPGEAAKPVSGILLPYYIPPTASPYSDTNAQRLLGLMRQHHDVPVMVILNPASGPGTFDPYYASFITLLKAAGGTVLGYVATGFGTRPEANVKADIDLWQSLYTATPIDGIFLDEMPYDTGPGGTGTEYVDRYKMYTDYCHTAGLAPTVANPGANQQPAYFATYTADVIVVHEDLTWPSEASMAGNYVGGHADYSYERRAALVYNQPSLDTGLLATLRQNVQWVYVTNDNLTAGVLNPWDTLPSYLEGLFSALASGQGGGVYVQDTAPASPVNGTLWWDSVGGQLYVWYDDPSADAGQWVVAVSASMALSPYSIGLSYVGGVLGASQLLGLHKLSRAVTFPVNFSGSTAGATANATSSTVISIDRALAASPNTFSAVGTLTFAGGGIAATFASTGGLAVLCAAGDVLRLMGPATADTTLANVYCTLVGS